MDEFLKFVRLRYPDAIVTACGRNLDRYVCMSGIGDHAVRLGRPCIDHHNAWKSAARKLGWLRPRR